MAITILCVLMSLVVAVLIGMALFVGVVRLIDWFATKDRRMQREHREYVRERRKNKVYDNYLTRFEGRG